MKYEGEWCVWYVNGIEKFRMKYEHMSIIAAIYGTDHRITEQILHWAQMLNNPD